MRKDVLDKLMKHCMNENETIEEHKKKQESQNELNEVNELEIRLVGKVRLI